MSCPYRFRNRTKPYGYYTEKRIRSKLYRDKRNLKVIVDKEHTNQVLLRPEEVSLPANSSFTSNDLSPILKTTMSSKSDGSQKDDGSHKDENEKMSETNMMMKDVVDIFASSMQALTEQFSSMLKSAVSEIKDTQKESYTKNKSDKEKNEKTKKDHIPRKTPLYLDPEGRVHFENLSWNEEEFSSEDDEEERNITRPPTDYSGKSLSRGNNIRDKSMYNNHLFYHTPSLLKISKPKFQKDDLVPESLSKFMSSSFGSPTLLEKWKGYKDYRTAEQFVIEFDKEVIPYCKNNITAVHAFLVNIDCPEVARFKNLIHRRDPIEHVLSEFIKFFANDSAFHSDISNFISESYPAYENQAVADFVEYWLRRLDCNPYVRPGWCISTLIRKLPKKYSDDLRNLPEGCTIEDVIFIIRESELGDRKYFDQFKTGSSAFAEQKLKIKTLTKNKDNDSLVCSKAGSSTDKKEDKKTTKQLLEKPLWRRGFFRTPSQNATTSKDSNSSVEKKSPSKNNESSKKAGRIFKVPKAQVHELELDNSEYEYFHYYEEDDEEREHSDNENTAQSDSSVLADKGNSSQSS